MQFFQSVSLSERKLMEKNVWICLLFCFSLLGYCYILCSASSCESALCVGVCLVLLKARNAVLSWGFLLSWSPLFSHWGWAQRLYLPEGEVGENKEGRRQGALEGSSGLCSKISLALLEPCVLHRWALLNGLGTLVLPAWMWSHTCPSGDSLCGHRDHQAPQPPSSPTRC